MGKGNTFIVSFPFLADIAASISENLKLPHYIIHPNNMSAGEKHLSLDMPPNILMGSTVFFIHTMRPLFLYEDIFDSLCALELLKKSKISVHLITLHFPFLRGIGKSEMAKISYHVYKNALLSLGINTIHTLDPHVVDTPWMMPIDLGPCFKSLPLIRDTLMVLPDKGAARRYKKIMEDRGLNTLTLSKTRTDSGIIVNTTDAPLIKGKSCFIIDDMVDSGSTLRAARDFCKNHGAVDVLTYATHHLGSGAITDFTTNSLGQEKSPQILDLGPALSQHILEKMRI